MHIFVKYFFPAKLKAKRSLFAFLLVIFIMSILSSCKKFVQIPPPTTQIVTVNVFSNSYSATSALINIYQEMYLNKESFNMALNTGLLSDELTNYGKSQVSIQEYRNAMIADLQNYFGPWVVAYNYIYQANAIIEGLDNNTAVLGAISRQLTGEAKFIRAFWNFYLTNCYGDIPLVLNTDYTTNESLSRTPKAQVFNQIIADLKDAQGLLNSNFVDGSDTAIVIDRIRPTKWAAEALLARAYLYTNDYVDAEALSTNIINNTKQFELVDSLNQVFLMNSNEAIWQLGTTTPYTDINTYDGNSFILQSAPFSSSQPWAISPQLISAFEPGDRRRVVWIDSLITTSTPIDTFYYPFKYQVYTSANISEYTMVLRLAEQYLIRAEARAQGAGTGLSGAVNDLNVIRFRAGLTGYSGPMTQSAVLDAIYHERQVELFTEWGHRWFDLVRSGRANTVLGQPGNVCQFKGGVWSPNWMLFPISLIERTADPNLSQNSGY